MRMTANKLKWVAIAAMIIDHISWFTVADETLSTAMHTAGRLAAPIFFFFLAEGYHHTKNYWGYVSRLSIFTLISHIPYSLFINYPKTGELTITTLPTSIIFTLLLALLVLKTYDTLKEHNNQHLLLTLLIPVSLLLGFITDWGTVGIIIPLIFHIFRNNPTVRWVMYVVVMFTYVIYLTILQNPESTIIAHIISAPILILLLSAYSGEKGKKNLLNKWGFYVIYPTHFLIRLSIVML